MGSKCSSNGHAVVKQWAVSGQAIVRQWSSKNRQWSSNGQVVVKQRSSTGQIVMICYHKQMSHNGLCSNTGQAVTSVVKMWPNRSQACCNRHCIKQLNTT